MSWKKRVQVALLVAALTVPVHGYVVVTPIEELVRLSDRIVLATVTEVRESHTAGRLIRHAKARVLESWKGYAADGEVEYIASAGWFLCDVSDAKVGETIVLFLDCSERDCRITRYGNGRMLVDGAGASRVARFHEVTFPAGVVVSSSGKWPYCRSVQLDGLKQLVLRLAS